MVNANADALGIIFPNSYDEQVPDLVKRASDGLHSFCQPLPHGGLYFIQHGKLRNRKCIHYRPQKLPFADGSSRLRT